MLTEDLVRQRLQTVSYPGFRRDIISFGVVRAVQVNAPDQGVTVLLALSTNDPAVPQKIKDDVHAALEAMPGVGPINVRIDITAPPAQGPAAMGQQGIPGVRHVIAIASGKGGVGKSTVAANLAVALARAGSAVGLCDCDMYGPSAALMFGTRDPLTATEDNQIIPIEAHGIKLVSMGSQLGDDAPAIMRGPMVTRLTQQFLRQTSWGELDYLILDLPPGTGDIQLTIVQTLALAGAIIVTTPQEVALIDARKAATMFAKTNVPVLGIIENMAYFECPDTGKRYDIFGSGGGQREATRLRVKLLGQIPIDIPTREAGDRGMPVVAANPEGAVAREFAYIARGLQGSLDLG